MFISEKDYKIVDVEHENSSLQTSSPLKASNWKWSGKRQASIRWTSWLVENPNLENILVKKTVAGDVLVIKKILDCWSYHMRRGQMMDPRECLELARSVPGEDERYWLCHWHMLSFVLFYIHFRSKTRQYSADLKGTFNCCRHLCIISFSEIHPHSFFQRR